MASPSGRGRKVSAGGDEGDGAVLLLEAVLGGRRVLVGREVAVADAVGHTAPGDVPRDNERARVLLGERFGLRGGRERAEVKRELALPLGGIGGRSRRRGRLLRHRGRSDWLRRRGRRGGRDRLGRRGDRRGLRCRRGRGDGRGLRRGRRHDRRQLGWLRRPRARRDQGVRKRERGRRRHDGGGRRLRTIERIQRILQIG